MPENKRSILISLIGPFFPCVDFSLPGVKSLIVVPLVDSQLSGNVFVLMNLSAVNNTQRYSSIQPTSILKPDFTARLKYTQDRNPENFIDQRSQNIWKYRVFVGLLRFYDSIFGSVSVRFCTENRGFSFSRFRFYVKFG